MNRLPCCAPLAYDGASTTIVHGPLCDKAEEPLTPAEMAEWRGHPMTYKTSHLKVVEVGSDARTDVGPNPVASATSTRKRRSRITEWWDRDPRYPGGEF